MRRPAVRCVTAVAIGMLPWVAPPATAATAPDVAAMTLTSSDLPSGAHLVSEHRIGSARGSYERTFAFSGRAARQAGMSKVSDDTVLFRNDLDAFFVYLGAQQSFTGRKGRHRLAAEFARRFHVAIADARVSRPLRQGLADGAFTVHVTVRRPRRTIGATVAVLLYGRVLAEIDVLGAPGAGHLVRRTHALLEAARAHIRAVLLPALVARPTIVGTPAPGATVQATAGAWGETSPPTSFRYRWQRCTADGMACASIRHATHPFYTVRARDEGSTLRVLVTAVDDVGRVTVGSAVSPVVGGAPPVRPVPIVAPGTSVLGRTYADWEVADWHRLLAAPTSIEANDSCALRQHPGMWFLAGLGDTPVPNDRYVHSCSVPAGTLLFPAGPGVDCSTVEPPPWHAVSDHGLRRCARRDWAREPVTVEVTLDGRPVDVPAPFATPVFAFDLPRHNVLGVRRRHGRAAVYGTAVIFPPLPPGRHTIVKTTRYGGSFPETTTVTFRLRVR